MLKRDRDIPGITKVCLKIEHLDSAKIAQQFSIQESQMLRCLGDVAVVSGDTMSNELLFGWLPQPRHTLNYVN